jgi:hypothetical protein
VTPLVWALLGILGALYVTMLVVLGTATLRRGHVVLFVLGIFLPFLWIFGAVTPGPNDVPSEPGRS